MKLYEYQKELINSQGKNVLVNWCRGAGMDTAFANYILENKPATVLLYRFSGEFRDMIKYLNNHESDYKFEFVILNREDIKLTFLNTDKSVLITRTSDLEFVDKKYDLIISKNIHERLKNIDYTKHINGTTRNVNKLSKSLLEDFNQVINVDYKRMISEDFSKVDQVIYSARKSDNFYNEYDILGDIDSNEVTTFDDFRVKALQKLMKQFLSIPDTKDTVLTRKNIIEMIKDLKQLGLN